MSDAFWALTVLLSSMAVTAVWFVAIFLVALKLGSANGSYRLLTLVLALCIILTLQAVGFAFNALEFPRNVTPAYQGGALFVRGASLVAALAVIYFGRPGAPPKTRGLSGGKPIDSARVPEAEHPEEDHLTPGQAVLPRQVVALEPPPSHNDDPAGASGPFRL